MHYEINVTLHGNHLFATHDRSIPDPDKARAVYGLLCRRFPQHEGFGVSVMLVEEIGRDVTPMLAVMPEAPIEVQTGVALVENGVI
jgi:hypothetical protein